VCSHTLFCKSYCKCIHLQLSDLTENIGAQFLMFYKEFKIIFQYLWNQMCNNALWSLPTDSLGNSVECVRLLNNLRCFEILFFRNAETFTIYCPHVFQKNYYSPTFHLQFVQDMIRFYSWWNLRSSTSVTSLNTYITIIDVGISFVSYFVYRGSLQTSCDIWSRIKFKKMFLCTEYPK